MPGRAPRTAATALCFVLPGLLAAAHAAPAAGRYEARLCVATTSAPDCGPASVELRGNGLAKVRISDMLYALTLKSSQVDVVLKHGAMQIDAFTGLYEWKGEVLHFTDADKGVRYEVQLGERRGVRRREPR
jgi:hypothetical protein